MECCCLVGLGYVILLLCISCHSSSLSCVVALLGLITNPCLKILWLIIVPFAETTLWIYVCIG